MGGAGWERQRALLYMQLNMAESPQQTPGVWQFFNRLYLPQWDLDFIRRVLWKKLPIGGRMGHHVGSKLCPLCHRLEDHEHMLRNCRSAFIFDTVRKAQGGCGRAQQTIA